ncbi:M48 family metallopeptidase [Budviciaceae bacterium CWB-B4]|uniref:M48 family metallopeptidase n=1 Tax=Limnobaculum xujianqingii TaxID=2738837 RepID=A0A9D7AHR6_9GAMM|nr:M48 family metallopeptidase [Limnobaculum xujianqingii]MBK5072927.1 M48 family metallopeptidase [Limnobaculum xujianqingii]MBK5176236.1 M48 family metallopeptidase [Limnobaculum xujianqingii]
MNSLPYLTGYPEHIQLQVAQLVKQEKLGALLLSRYPVPHIYVTDKMLYQYVMEIKNQYMKNAQLVSKVCYDNKIHIIKHALGLHTSISRIQGSKLKSKAEIRISNLFKSAPETLLRMIVVHELAHLKEKQHNKDFYNLCCYMEPDYHQLELDTRLYLTFLDKYGALYSDVNP